MGQTMPEKLFPRLREPAHAQLPATDHSAAIASAASTRTAANLNSGILP